MFEDWRDWRVVALLILPIIWWTMAIASLHTYGGPVCVNGYDPTGCWGGTIQFNGVAVIALMTGLPFMLALLFVLSYLVRFPTVWDWIGRSAWRRRQLFRLLEG